MIGGKPGACYGPASSEGYALAAAFDRFCTPVQLERRKAGADKFERIVLDLPFGRLTGLGDGPADAPPVLLVHGWNAQAEFFQPLISACARQGLRVYAFDMPAHGQTREANPAKPSSTLVEWVETMIAATSALGIAEWKSVIAHSFGGLAACFAMGERPWATTPPMKARSLALIAGAAGMPSVIDSYAATDPAMQGDVADIIRGVEAATSAPLAALTIASVAGSLPTRLLLAHDPGDEIAKLSDLQAALASHPPAEEMIRPGAGHDGILFQREIIRAVAAFAAG